MGVVCGYVRKQLKERPPRSLAGLQGAPPMGANNDKNKGGWEQGYNCSTTLLSVVISSLNFREACHENFGQAKMLV